MKKRLLSILLACAMLVAVFAGCGNNNGGDSSGGDKTVVIGYASDLKTLDPGQMYEVFGNMYSYAVYDMLFRIEGDDIANPKPSLVKENWTLDETRTVYTLPLRDDVTFSSGNKLTSKDVLFTINRVRNLKSNTMVYVDNIKDVTAPDDYTVVITLEKPDASFLTKMAANALGIVDSEVVKQNGGTDAADAASTDTARTFFDANSAGSGPYVLEKWTPNVELVLKKNPNYWGESGNVDTYILKEIPDSNTQIQMLEKGEIDVAFTLNQENAKQLEGKDGISLVRGTTALSTFLVMNNDQSIGGPLANQDVQKAVRLAIDYKGLQDLCGEGATTPLNIIPQGFTGATNRDPSYTNVEEAKKLMAQAGYADGFNVTMTVANYDTEGMQWTTLAQKVQTDLAQIGINIEIKTTEIGVAIDEYRNGTAPLLLMHWSPDYFDVNNQLAFLPDDVVGQRAKWTSATPGYDEMKALADQIMGEADNDKRVEECQKLQQVLEENGNPYAFLLQHPKVFGVSNRLQNITYNDLSKLQLKDITVQ